MTTKAKGGMGERRRKRLLFYSLMIIWPVIWWLVFYLYLNVDNIVKAFSTYNGRTYEWYGLQNFKNVFYNLFHEDVLVYGLKNSIIVYFTGFGAGLLMGQIFSFYIYKGLIGTKFFRTVLFLPSIVPGIAFVLCFKYMTDRVIPFISLRFFDTPMKGLLSSSDTAFGTLVFYFFWQGFAGSTVIYSNAMMSNVDPSVTEATLLDGATAIQEYFYVTLPLIFPTMQIFLISDIGAILGNQINLYTFYGPSADPKAYMIGYYTYVQNLQSTSATIPYLAALNLVIGILPLPIIYTVKGLTDKKIDSMMQ